MDIKGLQRTAWDCKGLQGTARDYKGLQRAVMDSKGLNYKTKYNLINGISKGAKSGGF